MWHQGFEHTDKKNKNSKNIYIRRETKQKNSELTKEERFNKGVHTWVSYWRANPQRFVTEYLNIYPFSVFQGILLYMMFASNYFIWLASRGLGKSHLVAIYCIVRCILFPGTKIAIASGTKGQSLSIISEKIKGFYSESPLLQREIIEIKDSITDPKVIFANGSWIKVVAARQSSRSARSNVLIVDEFRMVDNDVIRKVLTKFLTSKRRPKFLDKPEYKDRKDLQESNTEIYLSSAWYKNHWSWDKLLAYKDKMMNGEKYFTCGLPYQMGIKYGILDDERILDEMSESDFDPVSFAMEMECLPFGESSNAHFSFDEILKTRVLRNVFQPLSVDDYVRLKEKHGEVNYRFKNPTYITRKDGEVRVMGMDIALMSGANNDATCFVLMRLIPNGKSFNKYVDYIETMEGEHSFRQAVRLKQLYYDYDCDIVAMDTNGNGLSVYEDITRDFIDPERGTEYQAFMAFNDEKMAARRYEKEALPVVLSIKTSGSNAREQLHQMHTYAKNQFETGKINLLMSDLKMNEAFQKEVKFKRMSAEQKADYYIPFFNTTRLVNEMINLEKTIQGGLIVLKETGSGRKDRYMALTYALSYAQTLEKDMKNKRPGKSLLKGKSLVLKRPTNAPTRRM